MFQAIQDFDTALTLSLNGSSSLFLDGLAMCATQTWVWLPAAALLFVVIVRNNELRDILTLTAVVLLAILIADQTASGLFKPLVGRLRPTNNPDLFYVVDTVNGYRGGKYGFFSSHAANTFALATLLTYVVRHRLLSLTLFAWAGLNCWTRVYLGVHYVGDLVCGASFGVFVGWLCFRLWLGWRKRYAAAPESMPAYRETDCRMLILILLLSFLFCVGYGIFFG